MYYKTGKALGNALCSTVSLVKENIEAHKINPADKTEDILKTEKTSVFQWIRNHKKGVIIGAVTAAAFVGVAVFLVTKNQKTASNVAEAIVNGAKECPIKLADKPEKFYEEIRIYIEPHLRNLPLDKHPSLQKIATAFENGFDPNGLIENNQTWVKGYWKTITVRAKNTIREIQKAA